MKPRKSYRIKNADKIADALKTSRASSISTGPKGGASSTSKVPGKAGIIGRRFKKILQRDQRGFKNRK